MWFDSITFPGGFAAAWQRCSAWGKNRTASNNPGNGAGGPAPVFLRSFSFFLFSFSCFLSSPLRGESEFRSPLPVPRRVSGDNHADVVALLINFRLPGTGVLRQFAILDVGGRQ